MEHLQATERTLAPEIDALFRSLDDDEVGCAFSFFIFAMATIELQNC